MKSAELDTFDVVVADQATAKLTADCEAADVRLVTPNLATKDEALVNAAN